MEDEMHSDSVTLTDLSNKIDEAATIEVDGATIAGDKLKIRKGLATLELGPASAAIGKTGERCPSGQCSFILTTDDESVIYTFCGYFEESTNTICYFHSAMKAGVLSDSITLTDLSNKIAKGSFNHDLYDFILKRCKKGGKWKTAGFADFRNLFDELDKLKGSMTAATLKAECGIPEVDQKTDSELTLDYFKTAWKGLKSQCGRNPAGVRVYYYKHCAVLGANIRTAGTAYELKKGLLGGKCLKAHVEPSRRTWNLRCNAILPSRAMPGGKWHATRTLAAHEILYGDSFAIDELNYNYDAYVAHPDPLHPVISGEYTDVSRSGSSLLIGGVFGASAVVIIMLIFCLGLAFGMIIYWG
eukprot:1156285_1